MSKAKKPDLITTDQAAEQSGGSLAVLGWTAVRNLGEAMQLAEIMAKSAALPDCRNAGQILLKILAGAEMGFGPFASLTGVDIVEGKPSVGAHLKAAAIKRSDKYDYEVIEQDEAGTVCEVAFFERIGHTAGETRKFSAGWKRVGTVRMTIDLANAKGLTQGKSGTKNNWRAAPADMLFARCITKGYKRYCPDISGGVRTYDPDELDQPAEVVVHQEQVSLPPAAPATVQDAEVVASPQPARELLTNEQIVRIRALRDSLKTTDARLDARARDLFGVPDWQHTTPEEASQLIERMEKALAPVVAAAH